MDVGFFGEAVEQDDTEHQDGRCGPDHSVLTAEPEDDGTTRSYLGIRYSIDAGNLFTQLG